MAWLPIDGLVPQATQDGDQAAGMVFKFYEPGTVTPLTVATDSTGGTTTTDFLLDSQGRTTLSSVIVIPHVNQTYKVLLYLNQTDADADDTGSAVYSQDNITIPAGDSIISNRNRIVNGGCNVQDGSSVASITTSYQAGTCNNFQGKGNATVAAGSGTFGATLSAGIPRLNEFGGIAVKFGAITCASGGVLDVAYDMVSADSKDMAFGNIAVSCWVYSQASDAAARNYSIKLYTCDVADVFSAVTLRGTSATTVVSDSTDTQVTGVFDLDSFTDKRNGIRLEFTCDCGSTTSDDFYFSGFQVTRSSAVQDFDYNPGSVITPKYVGEDCADQDTIEGGNGVAFNIPTDGVDSDAIKTAQFSSTLTSSSIAAGAQNPYNATVYAVNHSISQGASFPFDLKIYTANNTYSAWVSMENKTNASASTTFFHYGLNAALDSIDFTAIRNVVAASPPFDIGDGQIPFFIYAKVENGTGRILGVWTSTLPPWYVSDSSRLDRREHDYKEVSGRRVVERSRKIRRVRTMPTDLEKGEIVSVEKEVETLDKNRHMGKMYHPWVNVPDGYGPHTTVMIDPCETQRILELDETYRESADEDDTDKYSYTNRLFKDGDLLIDNTPMTNRKSPHRDVMVVPVKWK